MVWPLLDESYPLAAEQIAFYRQNGYIKLKEVLWAELIGWGICWMYLAPN